MAVLGKIYNNNCSFNIEIYEGENPYYSPDPSPCDDSAEEGSCDYLERGSLIVGNDQISNWTGFLQVGDRDVDVVGNPNSGYYGDVNYKSRELNISFIICADTCKCWSEKINCLFANCCDESGDTYLEYINDCGRVIRLKVIITSTTYEPIDNGCGSFNIQLKETSGDTIEISRNELVANPTMVNKLSTITQCIDCPDTCLSTDVYNKTKEYEINAHKDKIVILADAPMDNFTLFWNDSGKLIALPRTVSKPDIIEIFRGKVYLNSTPFLDLATLGWQFDLSTTSNGENQPDVITDKVRIETSSISASAIVINFEEIPTCSYPILGQPTGLSVSSPSEELKPTNITNLRSS